MRIVVNHLTRMAPGFICVAGVDLATRQHVRPVCNRVRLSVRWAEVSGVFGIGNVVELGRVRSRSTPPHVEDREFLEQNVTCRDRSSPDLFWSMLEEQRTTRLRRIFGPELRLERMSCWTEEGSGRASLGVMVPDRVVRLYMDEWGSIRLVFSIGRAQLNLSVADLRFYGMDEANAAWIVRRNRLTHVASRVNAGSPIMLSVGLTRASRLGGNDGRRHWLQVNNIHLKDDPLGNWARRVEA